MHEGSQDEHGAPEATREGGAYFSVTVLGYVLINTVLLGFIKHFKFTNLGTFQVISLSP